jgi:hypothetical protein
MIPKTTKNNHRYGTRPEMKVLADCQLTQDARVLTIYLALMEAEKSSQVRRTIIQSSVDIRSRAHQKLKSKYRGSRSHRETLFDFWGAAEMIESS